MKPRPSGSITRFCGGSRAPFPCCPMAACAALTNGEIRETLHRVLRERASLAPENLIVIELSGLADPASVIATIVQDRYLERRIEVSVLITMVDCIHSQQGEAESDDFVRQILAADVLLLTKTDLASQAELEGTRSMLDRLHPT